MALTEQKRKYMEKLSDENGIISALAFDQRGALKPISVRPVCSWWGATATWTWRVKLRAMT